MDGTQRFGPGDHACWRFRGAVEFRARARDYLADGLRLGQRARYVTSGEHAALVGDVRAIPGIEEALERGAAEVISVDQAYPAGSAVDAVAQVEAYANATEAALAAGFTGLRAAVVDVTSLVKKPAQLDAFARYEHLIDQYMVDKPFTALCAYNAERLDGEAITALARMHPATNQEPDAVRFQLYASQRRGCAAELVGELDLATSEAFARALEHGDLHPVAGRLSLDVTGVAFIDHHSVIMLAEYARTRGATLVLHTPGYMIRRLALLLDYRNVRVESPR